MHNQPNESPTEDACRALKWLSLGLPWRWESPVLRSLSAPVLRNLLVSLLGVLLVINAGIPHLHAKSEAPQDVLTNSKHTGNQTIPVFYSLNLHKKQYLIDLETALTNRFGAENIVMTDISGRDKYQVAMKFPQNSRCVVSLDQSAALLSLANRKPIPRVLLGINRLPLEKLARVYRPLGIKISGLYTTAPLSAQMALVKALDSQAQIVGVIFDQFSRHLEDEYQKTAQVLQLKLEPLYGQHHEFPSRMLSLFRQKPQAILLTQQNTQFQDKLKAMVVAAFKLQIPLIGGNAQAVKAGALAGFKIGEQYSIQQAIELIDQVCQQGRHPGLIWPNQYPVMINSQIATNLGFEQPDISQLQQKLEAVLTLTNKRKPATHD